MTISELRDILENLVEETKDHADDAKVKIVGNTYFLGHPEYYLSIAGEGFIGFGDIDIEEEEEDEND